VGTMTTFLDIYNSRTQVTVDNGQGASVVRNIVDSFLDAANGSLCYYGGFVVNMRSDNYGWSYDGSDNVVVSAQARGFPIVSGRQMVDWVDGCNSSSFGSIIWDGTTLGFTIAVDPRSRNLLAMLPTKIGNTALNGITHNGITISHTIKDNQRDNRVCGFTGTSGSYTVTS
jgi:hypothetical protein